MEQIIEQIIEKEYAMLDKVNNYGGRTPCQDDFQTFRLMRMSQFLTWPRELLRSYLADLDAAEDAGRNLMFEKYAWMMQSALPEEFEQVRHVLPQFTPERTARMEETVAIQVAWAEEFAARYPVLSGRGRPLRTAQDTPCQTSVETYMRGELATYSDRTEALYHAFVCDCRTQGRNLTTEVRAHQARLLGWPSLEAAERRYGEKETSAG